MLLTSSKLKLEILIVKQNKVIDIEFYMRTVLICMLGHEVLCCLEAVLRGLQC